YNCEECGKGFQRAENLRRNYRKMHLCVRQYSCRKCWATCNTMGAFNSHNATHPD
ncbi:predicted protein, partial [Nematostella vectensis]